MYSPCEKYFTQKSALTFDGSMELKITSVNSNTTTFIKKLIIFEANFANAHLFLLLFACKAWQENIRNCSINNQALQSESENCANIFWPLQEEIQ